MNDVGRLLRALRLVSRLSVEDAAAVSSMAPGRLRELESGADLSYLEGLRVAKSYLLCPNCFKRHFEGAVDREMKLAVAIGPLPEGTADTPSAPIIDALVESIDGTETELDPHVYPEAPYRTVIAGPVSPSA